jgi:prolipoprotein diacylglyceryl transferase
MFESIGPIAPRWYGLMFALSFYLGYKIGARTFLDAKLPLQYADSLFLYLMAGTVLGARLGHVIFYDREYYLANPGLILAFWEGGLASHGAVIGVLTSVWLFTKKHKQVDFLWAADRMALPFTLGGFFVRFGNFFNSEILGKPSDAPWAVVFTRIDDIPRHPSMLYEAFWYLGAFAFFVWIYKKYETRPPKGALTALFLVVLFVGRFLIEFTKENQSAFEAALPINMGQILSLVCIVIGGIWLSRIQWKKS